jgi:hypothetical protein
MDISINVSITPNSDVTTWPFCVPARNPLGYVEYYAPALACKLRLVLHHI